MPIQLSPVIAAKPRSLIGFSSFLHVDLDTPGVSASPVAVLNDFRVASLPFCPHPHAGFAAVTYVLEDSPGDLRSRASSGIDIVVGPGGSSGRTRETAWSTTRSRPFRAVKCTRSRSSST